MNELTLELKQKKIVKPEMMNLSSLLKDLPKMRKWYNIKSFPHFQKSGHGIMLYHFRSGLKFDLNWWY